MRYLVLLLPFLTLLSCASISEEQCRTGDWEAIGRQDGKAGRSPDYLGNHAKACAEIGVTPDQSAWDRGRIQGLRLYCTPENAYSIGRNGDAVNNVCPASAVGVLTRANAWGQEYYGITGEIADLHDERDEIRALLATLTGELSDEQKALRRTYRERLLRLDGKLFDLERDRRRFGSLPQSLVADL